MSFYREISRRIRKILNSDATSLSQCENIRSINNTPNPKAAYADKRASFCILKKASLTVEAAFVLPMFFMIIICIISVMGIYSKTLDEMVQLRDKSEGTAAIASVAEKDIWIRLPGQAEMTPFFLPSGIGNIKVNCIGYTRAWTGRSSDDTASDDSSQYVYVAENASVYHTSASCSHIKLSIRQVSSSGVEKLRNENREKYHACERCVGKGEMASVVYITDEGDRYHNSAQCSGLKRNVSLVEKSEAEDLPACSKCGSHT